MVRHCMNLLKIITEFPNLGQIPIIACDCPIFAQCKYIQWICLRNLLASSGWTAALADSFVAKAGTVDLLLKGSHITRTQHAHQVTAFALPVFEKEAFEVAK